METMDDSQVGPNTSGDDLATRLEKITDQLQKEVSRLVTMEPISVAEKQLSMLREELDGIARLIAETRNEIAGLQPSGFAHSNLVCASDELDAVVGATERAAVEIMVAAEHAQEAAQRLRGLPDLTPQALRDLDEIETSSLDIFMACSFQDLTGQRIRKDAGMIGQTVTSNATAVTMPASGSVSVPMTFTASSGALSNVRVQVTNSSGSVVNTIPVSNASGSFTFTGVDSKGNTLAAGDYNLSLVGTGADGKSQSAGFLSMSSQVTGVIQESAGIWGLQLANGLTVGATTLTSMH